MKKFLSSVQFKILLIGLFSVIISTSVLLSINMLGDVKRPNSYAATQTLPTITQDIAETSPSFSLPDYTVESDPAVIADAQSDGSLALWVDGKRVPQTREQIAEWEKKLYACHTQAEYEAFLADVAYYNEGIDLSRFSWYWDDLTNLYSAEQIAIMKAGSTAWKTVPNMIGMEMRQAYRKMTDLGFLVRFSYFYDPSCTLPVGTCYYQDIPANTKWNVDACIMVNVQAPQELGQKHVAWHPDKDFDIIEYCEDLQNKVTVPTVVGLPKNEAVAILTQLGLVVILNDVSEPENGIPFGFCVRQGFCNTEIMVGQMITLDIQVALTPPTDTPPATETAAATA